MNNLLSNIAHYHVWHDCRHHNGACVATPNSMLNAIAAALPHGSGFDDSWTVRCRRKGGLTLYTTWHAMNGDGYYTGYFPVRIKVDFENAFAARLHVVDVRVNQRKTNDVKDYIWETVDYALAEVQK